MSTPPSFPATYSAAVIIGCLLFTLAILAVGLSAFGFWAMMIFASGFLGGFIIRLAAPSVAMFKGHQGPVCSDAAPLLGAPCGGAVQRFL